MNKNNKRRKTMRNTHTHMQISDKKGKQNEKILNKPITSDQSIE